MRELQYTALIEDLEIQRRKRWRNAVYESGDLASIGTYRYCHAVEVQPIPDQKRYEHRCPTQTRDKHAASYLNLNVGHTILRRHLPRLNKCSLSDRASPCGTG